MAASAPSRGVEELSEAIIRLTRASHSMRVQLAPRHDEGIDWAGFALLFQLVRQGPNRPSALAEAACVDPSTVSKQVADLVREGYVERRPDPHDGRATLLVATDEGEKLYEQRRARRLGLFDRVLDGWSAQDVAALTDLLDRFTDSFHAARPELLAALTNDKASA